MCVYSFPVLFVCCLCLIIRLLKPFNQTFSKVGNDNENAQESKALVIYKGNSKAEKPFEMKQTYFSCW